MIRHSSHLHPGRWISPLGFLILAAVGVELNFALYEIISIGVFSFSSVDGPLLSTLVASLSRQVLSQNRKITKMVGNQATLMSTSCAEALCTLIQNCEYTNLVKVRVLGNIEAAGWAVLAKALSLRSVSMKCLETSRVVAKKGRREDLRTIWESLDGDGAWNVDGRIFKSQGEEGWKLV